MTHRGRRPHALSEYASPRASQPSAAFRSLWRLAMVALLVMLFLVLALTGYSVAVYNGLVRVRAAVNLAWSDIDVVLVRRQEELPKRVEVCKPFMHYELRPLGRVC